MKKIKRYLPELVYQEIQKLNYKNKEHLYIICDMVIRSSIYKKVDTDYSNTFTDIPKDYFRDIISNSTQLGEAFTILKSSNIIKSDGIYSKIGGKALGYKFNDELISKLTPIELESKTFSKKIITNKNNRLCLVNDKYKKYKQHFISTFKIDYDSALRYIDGWFEEQSSLLYSSLCGTFLQKEWVKLVNKYNSLFISISAINDGELFFRRNKSNGRIDNNLTNLKSELKQFITIKDLRQVDIVNSQPFLLSLILSLCGTFLPKDEVEMYVEWVTEGRFYERFEREYFNRTNNELSRKKIKDIMFCILYSKNGSYQKEKNIFSSIFPNISKWITEQKKTKHNEFALRLQNIESSICIDCVCQKLDMMNINYYTIHDAWLVDKKDVRRTISIIKSCFITMYKTTPKLDTKEIN